MADEREEELGPNQVAVFRPGEGARDHEGLGYRSLGTLQRWSQTWPSWAQGAATRVQAFDSDDLTTAQVLGIAVGSAAAIGGLVVALQPEPTPPLPPGVERAIGVLPKGAQGRARRAARRVQQGTRGAGERAESARQDTAGTASTVVERAGEAATTARVTAGQALAALGSAAAASGAALAAGDETGQNRAAQGRATTRQLRREAERDRKEAEKARKRVSKRSRGATAQVREGAARLGDSAGGTLAAAGAAVAGAGSAIVDLVKPEERSMISTLQDSLDTATTRGRKLTRRSRRNLQKQIRQLQKQARQLQKQTRKQLPGRRSGPLDSARGTAADVGGNIGKGFAAAGAALAAPFIGNRGSRTEQLSDTAKQLAASTRERGADLTGQVVEVASKAGSRVTELASTGVAAGRSAIKDLTRTDAVERAGELTQRAGKTTRETAKDTRKATRETAKGARKATKRRGNRVTSAAGNAVGTVAGATKETGLILFWGAALGGIVLYGLLNDEQRAKVLGTASSVFQQGKELVRDFQGYDEEF